MARGLNKAMLIGNLGGDPEVRELASGDKVATLSVATSDQWVDKSGEKQESTQWHRVICWNKLAEIVEKYCTKGDRVYVEGAIQYRTWEDAEGNKKYTTEIKCFQLVMLGGNEQRARQPAGAPPEKEQLDEFPDALESDDDLPF